MSWSSILRQDCSRSCVCNLMLREGPCPGSQSFTRTAPGQVHMTCYSGLHEVRMIFPSRKMCLKFDSCISLTCPTVK